MKYRLSFDFTQPAESLQFIKLQGWLSEVKVNTYITTMEKGLLEKTGKLLAV